MSNSSKKRWLIGLLAAAFFIAIAMLSRNTDKLTPEEERLKSLAMQAYNGNPESLTAVKQAGTNAVPGLVRLLQSKDSFPRTAIWLIGQKLPGKTRGQVAKRIAPPMAAYIRETACRSLGLIGPPAKDAAPALAIALGDEEGRVRTEASIALVRIGTPAVPAVTATLSSRNVSARFAAANTLTEMGTNAMAAMPNLRDVLTDQDARMRTAAAHALANMGTPGVSVLIQAAKQSQGPPRDVAAAMLTNTSLAMHRAASGFFNRTYDQSPEVRKEAIEALGYIRADRGLPLVVAMEALKDPVPEVRLTAISALARIGDTSRDAVDTLVAYLKDESPAVRELAASTLGNIGRPAESAVPELTRIAESGSAAERNAAQRAIGQIRASGEGKK